MFRFFQEFTQQVRSRLGQRFVPVGPEARVRVLGTALASALLLAINFLVLWSYFTSTEVDRGNADRVGKGASQQLAAKTLVLFESSERTLRVTAELAPDLDPAQLGSTGLLGSDKDGDFLALITAQGTVLHSTAHQAGEVFKDPQFLQHNDAHEGGLLRGHPEALGGGKPVVPFLYPVKANTAHPGGFLLYGLPADELTAGQALPGLPNTVFAIIEPSGHVMSRTAGGTTGYEGELPVSEMAQLQAKREPGAHGTRVPSLSKDALIYQVSPVGDTGLLVVVGIDPQDATYETRKLYMAIVPMVALICLGILATTAFVLKQSRRLHRSISAREEAQAGLEYQASHDALTGLLNRTALHARLDAVLTAKGTHSLLFMDLDQFKVVNDTCGHVAGDELLKQVAYLLQQCLRKGDTLARMGGDEFAVLLESCEGTASAAIAEKLREAIAQFRFSWQDKSFQIGVSIGVVPVSNNGVSRAELMRKADTACYIAKDGGRNRVHFYYDGDTAMLERQGELDWASKLQVALARDQLTLLGQRIKSLQGADEADYFEVLVRMVNADGSLVPPMAFLPAAERYSLMPALDRAVITQAFRLHQQVQSRSTRPIRFAINLSGQSLSDPALLEFIERALQEHSINARSICFEVTETVAIANLQVAVTLMKQLKTLGFSLALDDFGSGMSSFSYLKQLPVDIVKIDGSFVRHMLNSPVDQAMVQAISTVSQRMGLRTLAEYVETEEIADALREMGVDMVQGYGVGMPESLEMRYGITRALTPVAV